MSFTVYDFLGELYDEALDVLGIRKLPDYRQRTFSDRNVTNEERYYERTHDKRKNRSQRSDRKFRL